MNWEAIGAVGEIVGAAAVLVTLIYLATQVRQNTGALRANAEQASIKSLRDLHSFLLSDDRLRVFRMGLEDWDGLDEDERARFLLLVHELLRTFESVYLLHRSGSLQDGVWEGWRRFLQDYAFAPGLRVYWGARQDIFSPPFRELVNSLEPRERGVRLSDLIRMESAPTD